MRKILYTNQEVSGLVSSELVARGWSVRRCCREFNKKNHLRVLRGEVRGLDKDFLQRVKSNNFKVLSQRVLELCLFLELDLCRRKQIHAQHHLVDEFLTLEHVIKTNPSIKHDLKKILKNLAIVAGGEAINEIC